MAILSKTSVGDVVYYVVDAIPNHVAPKGSISLLKSNTLLGRVFINNDGNTVWLKMISDGYGEESLTDATTGFVAGNEHVTNTWYIFQAAGAWVSGLLKDFTRTSTYLLNYANSDVIKTVTEVTATLRGGSSKWIDFEVGIAKNLTVPPIYNGATTQDNGATVNISCIQTNEFSNGDTVTTALRNIGYESGGGSGARTYIPKHCNLSVKKIDEGYTIFNETWASGNFTTNGWTVVNANTNIWVVGSAENNTPSGVNAAYISNTAGVSASYNINVANISHFYLDITIPSDVSGAVLSFDWKSWAENAAGNTQYDYGAVVIADTSAVPTANVEVLNTLATLDASNNPTGNGRIGAITNLGKFNLAYGGADNTWRTESIRLNNYAGQTKRLVFSWINDGSVGNNPPFVLDNLKLIEF